MISALSARRTWASLAGVAVLCVAVIGAGPLVVVALLVVLVALALLLHPAWALGVAVLVPLAIEPDWSLTSGLVSVYDLIPGTKISPIDALALLALAAGLVHVGGLRPAIRRLGPTRLPLALLALGLFVGLITGHFAGVGFSETINDGRNALELFLIPVAIVCVVGDLVPLKSVLGGLFAFAVLKSGVGVLAFVAHESSDVGSGFVTYYYAPTNILVMYALAFLLAARMRRVKLPRWMWLSAPLLIASLTLSFRRSFWLGTLIAVVLLLAFLLGPTGRRLVLPVLVVVALTFVLTVGGHLGRSVLGSASATTGSGTSSVSARFLSLNPTTLSENPDDRYRTEERRNVLADLSRSPVIGLGLGVPYLQRYPESTETIPHLYVHFAALWWWMKGGVVALAGYIAFIVALIASGAEIWRRHPSPAIAVAGAAAAAGSVGFAFAELTATFAGPDVRSSVLMGTILGLLAVGVAQCRRAERTAVVSSAADRGITERAGRADRMPSQAAGGTASARRPASKKPSIARR